MFMKYIAVLVMAVVLATGSPAMAQSPDLLASAATRGVALMTQEAEQEQTFVRRRRSGGLAWTGGILAGVGIVLALQPPNCALEGSGRGALDREYFGSWENYRDTNLTYSADTLRNECTIKIDRTNVWDDGQSFRYTYYGIDNEGGRYDRFLTPNDGETRRVTSKKTLNQVGWASVATGGVLLGLGLSGVDVPVRLDVAPGGFSVAHSLGW